MNEESQPGSATLESLLTAARGLHGEERTRAIRWHLERSAAACDAVRAYPLAQSCEPALAPAPLEVQPRQAGRRA